MGATFLERPPRGWHWPTRQPRMRPVIPSLSAISVGSVTSAVATLTVVEPPVITVQPRNLTNTAGTSANFSVAASGTGLSYQWRFNTATICGCDKQQLLNRQRAVHERGKLHGNCPNTAGSVTSSVATLTVVVTTPPVNYIATATVDGQCRARRRPSVSPPRGPRR